MTGNTRRQRIRFFLLASAVGAMMIPVAVRADDNPAYSGLPEIEIDGSVLEHLGKNARAAISADAPPVRLAPPAKKMAAPSLTVPTLTAPMPVQAQVGTKTTSVPTLTAVAGEKSTPPVARSFRPERLPVPTATIVEEPLPPLKTAIQPVIREIPAPQEMKLKSVARAPEKPPEKPIAKPVEKIALKPPAVKTTAHAAMAIVPPPVPAPKPDTPAAIAAVSIDHPKKSEPPVQPAAIKTEPARKEPELKISAQTVHSLVEDITTAPPAQPAVKPEPPVEAKAVIATANEIMPPKPGDKMTGSKSFENIKPPEDGKIAVFPVKTRIKESATLDPGPAATVKHTVTATPEPEKVKIAEKGPIKVWNNTAIAVEPVILGPAPTFDVPAPKPAPQVIVKQDSAPPAPAAAPPAPAPTPMVIAAAAPVRETDAPVEESWRQENPDVVIKAEVPVPGRRPEKQMASQEFVQQARRTVMETYTVMRNDGAPIPAVAKANVSQEKLPAIRMSVADLADDPLASRILDMSPAEVAATLNEMTPAAGRQLSREINAISKPRIVRQEGERIFKSRKNLEPVRDTAPAPAPEQLPPPVADNTPAPAPAAVAHAPAVATAPLRGERLDLALPFSVGAVDLSDEAKTYMENGVIPVLKSREGMRIQIVAFASPTEGKEATARRTALSRALAVRSYLIRQGVDATRMDVRALGMQPDPQAAKDKVDLHLVMPDKS